MRKRKRKREKKLLLLDNSVLRLLTPEQRKQLDSKHTILYPPILVVENAQHGLDIPSGLLDFENTVSVIHWAQRAKLDLLKGEASRRYKVGAKIPTLSIYEEPEADRKEMQKQAIRIVKEMDASACKLKSHLPILQGADVKLDELTKNHEEIPDKELVRQFNQAIREVNQNNRQIGFGSIPKGIGNRKIPEIRNFLDEYSKKHTVDSLGKAYEVVNSLEEVEQRIYGDPKSLLYNLCNGYIVPIDADERTEIFNRFKNEGEPLLNRFAPYALLTTKLYLTIFLYLVENKENSSPQGALRDFEYLYYAINANVTFVSSDKWHKKCIEEIPLLEGVRSQFKFLPHKDKDEQEFKNVLSSIGIKT